MVKLNNAKDYEHLCNVRLSKEKFPKAYAAKLEELVRYGMTEQEATQWLDESFIELELYYSPDYGCFAVETDAVDNGATIYDPYTGEECEMCEEED